MGLLRKTSHKRGHGSRFLKLRMNNIYRELGNQQRQTREPQDRRVAVSYLLTENINILPYTTHRNTVVIAINLNTKWPYLGGKKRPNLGWLSNEEEMGVFFSILERKENYLGVQESHTRKHLETCILLSVIKCCLV